MALRLILLITLTTVVLYPFQSLSAQQSSPTNSNNPANNQYENLCPANLDRPCVGLVLGGGGARGGAHVGVLKALQENGIPVDLVVGTSFGSFVGGLYATGKTPTEIEELLKNADWDSGYRDDLNRSNIPNRRKRQLDNFPIHLDLGLSAGGVKLPQGFLRGQGMKALIDSILGHYAVFNSFDDLPIPYRAVAADIETGEEVILADGDLATAIHISMSLPGILRPIEKDGRILVDGGIANNLPVSIAKSLGAEIIIAVQIGSPRLSKEDLSTGLTVLNQVSALLVRKNVEYQQSLLTDNDVLILPQMDSVNLLSFDKMPEAIAAGYKETSHLLSTNPVLQSLANQAKQDLKPNSELFTDALTIDKVNLNNQTRLGDDYILHRMGLLEGEHYTFAEINRGINKLYGQGTIARINTIFRKEEDENVLDLDVQEKEWGPGYLNLKLTFEDDFDSFSRYQVGADYRLTNLSPYGAEWYTTGEFGTEKNFFTELYWPIKNTGFFWETSAENQHQVTEYTLNGVSLGNVTVEDNTAIAGVGWSATDRFSTFLGGAYARGTVEIPSLLAASVNRDELDITQTGYVYRLNFDTLDHPTFPSQGWKFTGSYTHTYDKFLAYSATTSQFQKASENTDQLEIELNGVISSGRHSVRQLIRYQSASGDDPDSTLGSFYLGGFLNLSGNLKRSIGGRQVRFFSTVYTYRLAANDFGAIRLPLYLGLSAERGNAWTTRDAVDYSDMINSGSAFIGWNSPFGPAYLAYGKSETGEETLYVFLGIIF